MTSVANVARAETASRGRGAFYLGGAIDLVLGLDLLLFGEWIAGLVLAGEPELFGLSAATALRGLGVALLIAGADTILLARSRGKLARFLPAIPALNWAFAALMALALALGWSALTGLGIAAVLALGIGSAALAFAQSRAL